MKLNKQYLACLSIILLALASCKKGNQEFVYKNELFPVSLTGYNGSSEELLIKLGDFDLPIPLSANSSFAQSNAYIFKAGEEKLKLTVSEKNTGKQVLEKELKKTDGTANVNFLYMDGRIGPMPAKPAVENDKVTLIYMFQPTLSNYSEPVDFVMGKYYLVPQVFEEVARAKNVKPYEFCAPVSLPTFATGRQDYNGVITSVSFIVRICKAGTNIPYTDGTAYTWNALSSSAPKPAASIASSKLYIFSEAPNGNTMSFFTRLAL
uniref:hypothetical protein n=1 Tax=Pedobacter schmidteae TaxID=2201271 RepID=UPI000EADE47C|nr:hypothetical protein [Pedobacter schmidteae]